MAIACGDCPSFTTPRGGYAPAPMKLSVQLPTDRVDRGEEFVSGAAVREMAAAAVKDGRIKQGDLILMEGIGGGLAWGASLVRW